MDDHDTIAPAALREALARRHPGPTANPAASVIVRAPGRVNLIGEHTDYNDGFVLPVAIDLELRMAVSWTDDDRVEVTREDDGSTATIVLGSLPPPGDAWDDYVAGTAWSMLQSGLPVRGFRAVLASTVPIGAGLSSSAALELASAWALAGPGGPAAPAMDVARMAQRAENEHVGVRCGLMDQFASACGQEGHALLLDCRSEEWRAVRLPDDLVLVVVHTGVPRSLGESEYNQRRADCEEAVRLLSMDHPRVSSLRDVDLDMLETARERLPRRVHDRARHVITENDRVQVAVSALEAGDHETLGAVMAASHASLRDQYEVSCPELDILVDIAASTPGVVGSRMTGAGFGGCTVTLAQPASVETLRRRIVREYAPRSGRTPSLWTVQAVDGAGFLPD